jgi:hypothetical protein
MEMRLNETIKQLAEEARISVPTGLEVSEWIERYNETFAKLIVKEIESYIQEAEGDIDLVRFLIDRYLK